MRLAEFAVIVGLAAPAVAMAQPPGGVSHAPPVIKADGATQPIPSLPDSDQKEQRADRELDRKQAELERMAKEANLAQQNAQIDRQKAEAKAKADAAMQGAASNLTVGIVGAAIQTGGGQSGAASGQAKAGAGNKDEEQSATQSQAGVGQIGIGKPVNGQQKPKP